MIVPKYLKFNVYDNDKLIDSFQFEYSDLSNSRNKRFNSLIPASKTDTFLGKNTGKVTYKLYLTLEQLKDLQKLYAYQENYKVYWIDNYTQYKVYLTSDFVQKKIQYKDYIDLYEFNLILYIVDTEEMFNPRLQPYSNDFIIDTNNADEFASNYYTFEIGSNYGNSLRTSNSILYLTDSSKTLYIKEHLDCYTPNSSDIFTIEMKDLVYNINSDGWEYFVFELRFNDFNYVAFLVYPGYTVGSPNARIYSIFKIDGNNYKTQLDISNYAINSDKLSAKIYSINHGEWKVAYRINNDAYTLIDTRTFTDNQMEKTNYFMIFESVNMIGHIDSIFFSPDMTYTMDCVGGA